MPAPTETSSGLDLGTRPVGTKAASVIATPRIWAIGDSLTAGSGGTTGWSWRQHVGKMLDDVAVAFTSVGSVSSASTTWVNHWGVSGATISGVNTAISGDGSILTTADPDVVVLCPFGQNDLNIDGDSAAAVAASMDALLTVLRGYTNGRAVAPRVVMSSNLIGFLNDAGNDANILAYEAELATVIAAQVLAGLDVYEVDIQTPMRSPLGANLNDNQHPEDDGYRLIADRVLPALLNAIGLDAEWGRATS